MCVNMHAAFPLRTVTNTLGTTSERISFNMSEQHIPMVLTRKMDE
jgi:hypothetical protein